MKGVALAILLLVPAATFAQSSGGRVLSASARSGRVSDPTHSAGWQTAARSASADNRSSQSERRLSDPPADQQLKTRVEQRLSERRVRGIKVAAQGGSVTLSGGIASAGAKQDLVADVLKVEGVKEIVSELTIGKAESDQKLAERVAEQMRRSSYFTVFDDVEIGVDNGVVTLTGYVTQPIKSDDLARRASHVDGVQEFANKLEVLPASLADDRLRVVIANTLYRDPTFSNYASQTIPPIHIIVRNSSVLLTGIVNSEVERRQAENIVRGISGIIGVQNALRVER